MFFFELTIPNLKELDFRLEVYYYIFDGNVNNYFFALNIGF